MKKIFHFIKSRNLTGVENVVINICTLVHGYDYTIVSMSGSINKYLNKYGINHIIIPNLHPGTLLKVIKQNKPDIVQAHDAKMTVLLSFSGIYCHIHNITMISELHNNDPKMKKWWSLRSIIYLMSSIMFNHIITVTADTAYDYAYYKLIAYKTSVIKNVVNPYRIKECLSNNNQKIWDYAFLGRFMNQKDPLRFIKLIYKLKKRNSGVKAVMIGNGPLLSKAKDVASDLKLFNNIYFMGFQKNPYKYLQQSKILLITSKYEGLPLVALESLVIGTPVISTPLESLKEILINKSYNGIAYTNKDFIKKVQLLINNRQKYSSICNYISYNIKHINNIKYFVRSYEFVFNNC